nr:DExH-box ATP-dependent RNA helicase DExH12-like [Ipomoea batatas]
MSHSQDFKRLKYNGNSSSQEPPKSLWSLLDIRNFGRVMEMTMDIHSLFSSQPIPSGHGKKRCSRYTCLQPQFFIQVVCDVWLGFDFGIPGSFQHLVLPENIPLPTVLVDVQPLPVAALRNPAYEAFYQEFKHFNPVQTKVFNVLYNSDDNVLVAAPTGSGKTICSEFSILRDHQKGLSDSVMRVVYIAPREDLAKERYSDWKKKFGDGLGVRVVELTGETTTDLKLLEEGQVVISTPEKWDALSRRWKQWKHVQQVSLFIVDELHRIGDQGGHVLEVIVARMRYIASQLEKKIRIVALSTSVVNARDLGEWIGATSNGLFSFPIGPKPVPLGKQIQDADFANSEALLDKEKHIYTSIYTAIVQHVSSGKPAIVYVPSRKRVNLAVFRLKTYLRSQCANRVELPFVESIEEHELKEALKYGVCYLHEGLAKTDQDIVKMVFKNGLAQVCVISSSMCCGLPFSANLVMVMGTQHCDGRENGATGKDYCRNFMFEALFPVESQLQHYLHDHLNAEVVSEVIQNRLDAVGYLGRSFMYRRLTQNPNYYNLQGVVDDRSWLDHFSVIVRKTSSDLVASRFVTCFADYLLSPNNLGVIASNYYINYTTVDQFSSCLTPTTKLKGLLEILTAASEYRQLPIRPGEEELIRSLVNDHRYSFENPKYSDPCVKANALLQAHFRRQMVGEENLAADQQQVILYASRLLGAMVDVISCNGWLSLALLAMEVSQMVTQAMWECDSMLLQLPHLTKELAKKCQENPGKSIETVSDLLEMEDGERRELLQMPDTQLMDIARCSDRFPSIDVSYQVVDGENVRASGEDINLKVTVGRTTEVAPVLAPRYPVKKCEGWWVVVGDPKSNKLLAIQRVMMSVQRKSMVILNFAAPAKAGKKTYTLHFKCDSYVGFDKEYVFTVDAKGLLTAYRRDCRRDEAYWRRAPTFQAIPDSGQEYIKVVALPSGTQDFAANAMFNIPNNNIHAILYIPNELFGYLEAESSFSGRVLLDQLQEVFKFRDAHGINFVQIDNFEIVVNGSDTTAATEAMIPTAATGL